MEEDLDARTASGVPHQRPGGGGPHRIALDRLIGGESVQEHVEPQRHQIVGGEGCQRDTAGLDVQHPVPLDAGVAAAGPAVLLVAAVVVGDFDQLLREIHVRSWFSGWWR